MCCVCFVVIECYAVFLFLFLFLCNVFAQGTRSAFTESVNKKIIGVGEE